MKKILLAHLLLLFTLSFAKAQNFPLNAWTQEEMAMPNYKNDTSAHAVVLNEFGSAKIAVLPDEHTRLIYQYHVRIKIFDKNGFKNSTIEIPLYNSEDFIEEANEITGATTYKDNNGFYKTEKLDPAKIFTVKENKNHSLVKFALPGVKEGCIIEYSYTITTPYFQGLHDWQFQSDIPKMRSEYQVYIPGFWNFNISLRGDLKLTKNASNIEPDCFSTGGAKADCSHLTFAMDNIPAFVEEDYMTSPKNFRSAIYFELAEYTSPYTGAVDKVTKTWADVDNQLKRDDYVGAQIKKKDLLKDRITPLIIGNKTNDLDKAKIVYAYLQKIMKWNGFNSYGTNDGIRKALDKHTGSAGEINLSLVAALNAAGLNAEAVLLSTREHGIINKLYPVLTEFNYVIAKVDIANKTYLLDATDPILSFGLLPLRCLNDQGRVLSFDKPSYWIDMNTQQNDNNTYSLDLKLQENGKLKGTFTSYSIGYAAYLKRRAIKKFNSIDEYVENLDEKLAKVKITKSNIINVDSLDLPVAEVYEVEIDAYNNLNHDKLSFNPYLFDKITTNPFKLAERTYPVDWGVPSETRFILNIQLPEGYVIENPPQNISIGLPNQGGSFIAVYEAESNSFKFSHVISFKKSIYQSGEYPYLKELYNKIILSEKTEMIFKKKI